MANPPAAGGCLQTIQQSLAVPALIIFIMLMVKYFQTTDETCDATMRSWVLGLSIYKLVAPCFVCCCIMPVFMFCAVGAFMGGMDDESDAESGSGE